MQLVLYTNIVLIALCTMLSVKPGVGCLVSRWAKCCAAVNVFPFYRIVIAADGEWKNKRKKREIIQKLCKKKKLLLKSLEPYQSKQK